MANESDKLESGISDANDKPVSEMSDVRLANKSSTYKYRNEDKRREYQRELMRKRRQREIDERTYDAMLRAT